MKKVLLICLYAAFLASCQTESDVEFESPDHLSLALREAIDNQKLLDKVYEETARIVTADTLIYAREKSASLEEFVQRMSRMTKGVFEKAIKSQDASAADYFIKIDGVNGELKEKKLLKLLSLDDPLPVYASSIADYAKSISQKQGSWIILEAYKDEDGNTHHLPETSVSVAYEQIMAMIEMKDILISSVMSEEEQKSVVEELVLEANIPEAAIALLLPAVQKYSEGPSNDPFLNWVNTEVNSAVQGSLDRDIIRRKAFASFLGGLDLFVNGDFDNGNQDSASIQLMQARYKTMLMFIWAEIWNQ